MSYNCMSKRPHLVDGAFNDLYRDFTTRNFDIYLFVETTITLTIARKDEDDEDGTFPEN